MAVDYLMSTFAIVSGGLAFYGRPYGRALLHSREMPRPSVVGA